MKDVSVNDLVQTSCGFEPVIGFLHQSASLQGSFLRVSHTAGSLTLTAEHLVFLADGSSKTAAEVRVGDVLSGAVNMEVQAISAVQEKGFYAPLTASGTIVVDDVMASNYAAPTAAVSHSLAHLAVSPFRWICDIAFEAKSEAKTVRPKVVSA